MIISQLLDRFRRIQDLHVPVRTYTRATQVHKNGAQTEETVM